MKNLLTLFFLILISICPSFGQERINREKLHFIEQSGSIKEATGWSYNETLGEWIDFPNFINSNKRLKIDSADSTYSPAVISKSKQNFSDLHVKTIMFEYEKFYTLFIEEWKYNKKNMRGYIFSEEDFERIHHLKENEVVKLVTYAILHYINPDFDSDEVSSHIRKELERKKYKDTFPLYFI